MSDNTYDLNKGWDSLAAEMLYGNVHGGGPADEVAFYERRIRANGGAALDQACGAGRHLFPLIERGLDVHGADASADGLRLARMIAEQRKLQPELFHQTMEDFDVPHKYGTIYIANSTFQVICDRKTAAETLKRFRNHLSPGGQLLVELCIPEQVTRPELVGAENAQYWEPEKRRDQAGEISATLWTESVDLFDQILVEKRRYDLHIDGQVVRSELHTLRWTYYFKNEFIIMLESVGLGDIYLYSNYTEDPATKDSKTIVYGARNLS